jgi:hypothetical protein
MMHSSKETFKDRLARYRETQAQRHRQEIWEDDLDPSLVNAGGREALSSIRAGLRDAVVQERPEEPDIRIDARDVGLELRAMRVTDAKAVKSVIKEYGACDVKKYYSKFDVAVVGELGATR